MPAEARNHGVGHARGRLIASASGFVEMADHVPLEHGWVCRALGLALAIPLRVLALLGQVRGDPAEARRALRALAAVTAGPVAWMAGVLHTSRPYRKRTGP